MIQVFSGPNSDKDVLPILYVPKRSWEEGIHLSAYRLEAAVKDACLCMEVGHRA